MKVSSNAGERKNMQVIRWVLAGILSLSGLAHAGVEGAKLYTGPEGMKVTVVRLSGDPSVLLYVQGSDTHYDGKALPATQEADGDRTRYCTQYAGRDMCPFHAVTRYGGRSYVFYPGGNRTEISLQWDEKGSSQLKPEEVVTRYEAQKKDGTLAQFMAFDRPAEQASNEAAITENVTKAQGKCGTAFPLRVQWASVTDDVLKSYSVASYCSAPLEALETLCDYPSARDVLVKGVKEVSCTFGKEVGFALENGMVRWTTSTSGYNLAQASRKGFEDAFGGAGGLAPGSPPWGKGQSLRALQVMDSTSVCTDGKGYTVALTPGDDERRGRFYSSSNGALVPVLPEPPFVPHDSFLEPRYPEPSFNPNFRGTDMRVYSSLKVDAEKRSCVLRCGTRSVTLQLLPADKARALLLGATLVPNPQKYGPYALLRDEKGNYYYVEKGLLAENQRSFRVHVGPKGKLRQQKLLNLVSDSEGELFSTRDGELRLLLDQAEGSTWMKSRKKTALRAVPVSENLTLIYNELGVYEGARLGTPCDEAPL